MVCTILMISVDLVYINFYLVDDSIINKIKEEVFLKKLVRILRWPWPCPTKLRHGLYSSNFIQLVEALNQKDQVFNWQSENDLSTK